MAICVYEHGNTTIRNAGDALDTCTDFILLEPADYALLINKSGFLGLPDVTPEEGLQLVGMYVLLLATVAGWRYLESLFSSKGD